MNLSELIAKYGDDKIAFQMLDECAVNFSRTKHGTKATFVTSEGFGLRGFDKMGLVVWLDRKNVASILAGAATTDRKQQLEQNDDQSCQRPT